MLCAALLADRYSSSLGYIPCWTTILSSFIESAATDTARIVPIGNHISVFFPTSEAARKAKFMDAIMQTSPGLSFPSEGFVSEKLQNARFQKSCLYLHNVSRISEMQLSTSMIARQLRDMADRFEYHYIEEEQRSTCTPAPLSSHSQVRVLYITFRGTIPYSKIMTHTN
ncbi:unnamed protein product [Onchocerca flexuosa]|uniref:COesterase domain-containing protein n=1 Tax=Onchocerca flexuosa TaxID=387005 RepID=A0A183HWV0_9BILA|nr:unnamed protein product [Onchocerca flexuosa]